MDTNYWPEALERIATERKAVRGRGDTESAWNELRRLSWLEAFARERLRPTVNDFEVGESMASVSAELEDGNVPASTGAFRFG